MAVITEEKRRTKASRDLTAGYLQISDRQLHSTGIRGIRLFLLVACICLLWLMAIGTFVANILIIIYLEIGARGIPFLQFLRTDNGTSVLQFSAPETHFDRISTTMVGGWWGQDLPIEGQHINISTNATTAVEIKGNVVQMVGFSVRNSGGKLVFDAKNPTMKLSSGIKKMSAKQIITNRVRSPIGKSLKVLIDNVSFRGNEGNHFEGRSFNLTAMKGSLQVEIADTSALRMRGGKGIVLSASNVLPISTSPQLTADILAYRVCVCKTSGKLFLIEGNAQCITGPSHC